MKVYIVICMPNNRFAGRLKTKRARKKRKEGSDDS